jgi:O-antigen/teichoic acid export membrane protein
MPEIKNMKDQRSTDNIASAHIGAVPLTSGSLLARNATLNLVTEGWVFLVLIVAMPKLVSFLGDTQFGLFALAWVVIGYLAFLDVGVNRAATKFISEHLAEQDHQSTRLIVRTALTANLVLGLVGGLTVVLLSPYLIHSVFKVSGEMQGQTRLTFYAVALAVPVLLVHGVFRAVLSSYQRFGWINAVNAVATTVQWGTAALLAWKGHGVALVVFATVAARILATAAYGAVVLRLLPGLQLFQVHGLHGLPKLLRFGGWVSVSQLVSPLLVYLDRVLIASFVSLAAVTLYTVPYELMTRLRVIPSSLANTLYPAFSQRSTETQQAQLQWLYQGSLRYLLILMLPGILYLLVFGTDLLSLWMGASFAHQTSAILQILAVGALANALAYVPYNALQALGRPDLTGKFHLLELPLYVLLCVSLIPRWGIAGAALASTVRFALDAVLLFWAAQRYCACSLRSAWRQIVPIMVSGILLGVAMLGPELFFSPNWVRLCAGLIAVAIYFLASWRFVLSEREKPAIGRALGIFRHQPAS